MGFTILQKEEEMRTGSWTAELGTMLGTGTSSRAWRADSTILWAHLRWYEITTVTWRLISDQHLLWPGLELHTASSRGHLQKRDGLMIPEICICWWWILQSIRTPGWRWLTQLDPQFVDDHLGSQKMPVIFKNHDLGKSTVKSKVYIRKIWRTLTFYLCIFKFSSLSK